MAKGYIVRLYFRAGSKFASFETFLAGWSELFIGTKKVLVTIRSRHFYPKVFASRISAYFAGKRACKFCDRIKTFKIERF